jgi:ABC-type transport system involved in multi-copper enzyme maturation permease subunit
MACIGFDDRGIDVLFGVWQIDLKDWTIDSDEARATIAGILVHLIVAPTIGWVGIILALVATASTFPSMMESGGIDILLSKPINRTQVFLGKYAGAMVFILLQALIFVGLTFLVVGVRWKHWIWGYLWVIPLLVLLFSYLFCFTALFGVITRRAMPALLLTLIAWVALWVPQEAHAFFVGTPKADPTQRWRRTFATVSYVIPKTQDIPIIASKAVQAATATDIIAGAVEPETEADIEAARHARESEQRLSRAVGVAQSIGTSLAIEALVVLIAIWLFNRKDF